MELDAQVGPMIIRNLELLLAAHKHLEERMEPKILRETANLARRKTNEFNWAGEFDDDPSDTAYLAAPGWRAADCEESDDFDLYIMLGWNVGELTWMERFLGLGDNVILTLQSDLMTERRFPKAALECIGADAALADALKSAGFLTDPRLGVYMPIIFSREAIAKAFEDSDFDTALTPLAKALDRVHDLSPHLDRLVVALRIAYGRMEA